MTGASSGIGRATVTQLVAEGWTVLAVARRADRLAALQSELEAGAPGRTRVLALDLCEADSPARVVAAARSGFGGIDLLVNSAGTCRPSGFGDQTDAMIDEMIDLNLRALIRMCRDAVPALVASRGQIINVSSIASHVPFEYMATYCATKAGVSMFGRALARELRTQGVRVNTVSPDGTDTEMFEKIGVPKPDQLIPAADMARMIVTLTQIPPSVDVSDWVVEQRFSPKL